MDLTLTIKIGTFKPNLRMICSVVLVVTMKQIVLSVVLLCVFQKSSAIINGTNAGINPHHVSIIAYVNESSGVFHGGSLISNIHVLTGAYVVKDKISFRCGVGSNRRSLLTYINSNTSIIHPDYNILTGNSDLGIIILPWNSIPAFTANVAPVTLPPLDGTTLTPFMYEQGRMVSFGSRILNNPNETHEELLEGYQRVIQNEDCGLWIFNETNVFCGADPIFRNNFCDDHDRGIGLLVIDRGIEYIAGVTSQTNGCGGYFTGYVRVKAYRQWIFDMTGI